MRGVVAREVSSASVSALKIRTAWLIEYHNSPLAIGMKLRDHPLMTRKSGIKLWPPPWTSSMQDKPYWPRGEIGTLQRVWMHPRLGTCLFLFIKYDGVSYTGSMYFDDPRFCIDLYHLVEDYVGRSIAQIGDVDVSLCFDKRLHRKMLTAETQQRTLQA